MMLGIFNIIISVCFLSQGCGNRKTRGSLAWAMPNGVLCIDYKGHRFKMLGNMGPGWAGLQLV